MNAPAPFIPPHATEAEQAVIGALLIGGPAAWDRISDLLAESDFYRDEHRRLFRTIATMRVAGRTVDFATVAAAIEANNEVDQTGGLAYLAEIANAAFTVASIGGYARVVQERAQHRALISAVWDLQEIAMKPGAQSVKERMDRCEARILGLSGSMVSKDEPRPISDYVGQVITDVEDRSARDVAITGLPTGFADVDAIMDGLMPGDLIIIAGRPSMGKTAWALNVAEHCAVQLRKPSIVFSLEMGAQQLAQRTLASLGGINSRALHSGKMADEDWERLTVAIGRVHEAPLIVDQSVNLTASQMWSRARRQMRKTGLSLIVIDYLQLMPIPAASGNNRAADLGDATRTLKHMARDLGVPLICLSQLSRKVEERNDKRPVLSDLRESGAIEQDADVVAMLYRDEYYRKDSPAKGIAEFIVRKHRMGETGTVKLAFQPEFSRFRDLAPDDMSRLDHERAQTKMASSRRGFDGE